ncbi:MAG TPA: 2Fe-2S iron-sulfur cluster-binding protein, partial [Spirochaetota bacterium]|nr:2Fe-2S iron-sulfur cluster-binding protein [Spirochaetota bacterium]
MAQVNIIFNGQNFVSDDDLTILDFAKTQGVEIPTLCYDERLTPYGSCFLCVVEVKGARTLIPACATKLREGIEIQTTSKTTTDSRRTALELTLSNHYGDCIAP